MRNGILALVMVLTCGPTVLRAQTTSPALPASPFEPFPGTPENSGLEASPATQPGMLADLWNQDCANPGFRFWASSEYLLWWTRSASFPPLVTAGNPADAFSGAIGQPGTRVLFGGDQNYGSMNGLRLTLGGWFQPDWGFEASGFVLERRSVGFAGASDAAGNPALSVPIFRSELGRNGAIAISDAALGIAGNVNVLSYSQLWGSEANLLFNLTPNVGPWRLSLLTGFRYLDLQENALLSANTSLIGFGVQNVLQDSFATRNQFYGGQLGLKLGGLWNKFSLDLTGKIALGSTHQVVAVGGSDTQTGPGVLNGTFREGIFAQTSNIGRQSANIFGVIPQTQLKLGYNLTPSLRFTSSYDFLYWNRVARAGEQINPNVDLRQSVVFGQGAAASSPSPSFNRSGYWAQGVGFGLEFRY